MSSWSQSQIGMCLSQGSISSNFCCIRKELLINQSDLDTVWTLRGLPILVRKKIQVKIPLDFRCRVANWIFNVIGLC